MENKNNGKMMEMSEEKLESVAGGANDAGVGEIVEVEVENFVMRPGIVLEVYWTSWYGCEYYVQLGHYAEDGVTFINDGEEVCVNAAYVHRIYR